MKKVLKWAALAVAVALSGGMLVGWWYLHDEGMDPPPLAGTLQEGSLEHDGLRRTWIAYIPEAKELRPPLMLVLHGSMGDGKQMRAMTRYSFDQLADKYGFVVAYPDGYEKHWNDCRGSAVYEANRKNIDDVGFLRALVRQLEQEQGVDPHRVFAAGYSNGGQLAYRLALEAPGEVRGVAAIAANLPVSENLDCVPSNEPAAVLMIAGTEDPVNPFYGGLVEIFGDASRGEVLSAAATAEYWAKLAGYQGRGDQRAWSDRVDDGTTVKSTEWTAPDRLPVALVAITGGGHTIPYPTLNMPRILGLTSHEMDGAEVVWSFFRRSGLAKP